MKRLLLSGLALALSVAGCAALRGKPPAQAQAPAPALRIEPVYRVQVGNEEIQTIPFQLGVSSATVERMAREQGCAGLHGAGLITQPGPVEVYRMPCDGGKIFMARCELRQCKQM